MVRRSTLSVLLACVVLSGCGDRARIAPSGKPPMFDGMGTHHRAISTNSATAQRYFDQGLIWAYAFNHDEAIRSFEQAAQLDPNCAMAWWGVALCNGPHINNPAMPEERSRRAWDALQKAIALQEHAARTERELIAALSKRYADPPPTDRSVLDKAYADAMREVWQAHRNDADIGTLCAEAMMDLQPWDLWTRDGQAKGNAIEIVAVLEEVLSKNPNHPGAMHLYIHACEAGPTPEKAIAAADRLREAVPAAGHLVHMPSHIDVQVGRWALAADTNVKASEADRKYRKISPRQDFYRVYMAHNDHFLAFASMMEGRAEAALAAARRMIANVPEEYARKNAGLVDGLMGIEIDVLMRFGRWDEILREPAPPEQFPITRSIWRFARGVAYAAKGNIAEAEREQAAFEQAAAKVPADAMMSINPASKILAIARHMLAGEIAFRRGKIDAAASELGKAVEIEDSLRYMEPPDWVQPVRHTLGAVLVSARRFEEAERAYREDLRDWPENGWSLYGLAQCLHARGAHSEAAEADKRFAATWARADTKIDSSCLCTRKEVAAAAR